MRPLLFFLFSCCFLTGIAQTKLTLLSDKNNSKTGIDSIKIARFSNDAGIMIPYKDNVTLVLEEKYADLYSVDYYTKGVVQYKWQNWIDTGTITVKTKLKSSGLASSSLVIDTFINSPVTYAAKQFYQQLGTYRHRTDTAVLNELLIKSYKENSNSPFSFVIGRIYYDYNQNSIQQYVAMNPLEREQGREIKKSIFYAMMLRERFRNSEKLFINYLSGTVLTNTAGQQTSAPLDRAKYNIIFFAGAATTQAIAEFEALDKQWQGFSPKDFTFFIVYTSKDKNTWKPILEKSRIPSYQLVSEQDFTNQTLFYPDTKFYIVDGKIRIPGWYDSFTQVADHFKNR